MALINSNVGDFTNSQFDKLNQIGGGTSGSSLPGAPSNLSSFNSQNSNNLSSNNDITQGLPSNLSKKYSDFDNYDKNIPEKFINKSIDDRIKQLEDLYEELNKDYFKKYGDRPNEFFKFFNPRDFDYKEELANEAKQKRDAVFKLLTEARNQKFNYYSNLNTELNKYNIEFEALKRQGITNKFYLLKNGPIGNAGASLSTSSGPIMPNISKKNRYSSGFLSKLAEMLGSGILKKLGSFLGDDNDKVLKLLSMLN